jgi:hypothetical protein
MNSIKHYQYILLTATIFSNEICKGPTISFTGSKNIIWEKLKIFAIANNPSDKLIGSREFQ